MAFLSAYFPGYSFRNIGQSIAKYIEVLKSLEQLYVKEEYAMVEWLEKNPFKLGRSKTGFSIRIILSTSGQAQR